VQILIVLVQDFGDGSRDVKECNLLPNSGDVFEVVKVYVLHVAVLKHEMGSGAEEKSCRHRLLAGLLTTTSTWSAPPVRARAFAYASTPSPASSDTSKSRDP
jgi:hypothetical protein